METTQIKLLRPTLSRRPGSLFPIYKKRLICDSIWKCLLQCQDHSLRNDAPARTLHNNEAYSLFDSNCFYAKCCFHCFCFSRNSPQRSAHRIKPLMPSNLTQLTHGPSIISRRKCGRVRFSDPRSEHIFILGAALLDLWWWCSFRLWCWLAHAADPQAERDTQKQWQAELQPSGFFN